jgi:hypothetical protein
LRRLTVLSVLTPGVVQFGGCGQRKREPIADDMSLDAVRACIVRARNLKGIDVPEAQPADYAPSALA